VLQRLIERLKLTPAYGIYRFLQQRKTYEDWARDGIPTPPPPVVKQHIVRSYAERFSLTTLVETGTYLGEMVLATNDLFDRIYSVEIDETLARRARKKFSRPGHVTILQGDSGIVLGKILEKVDVPCLFWLDSHYSGGLTSKGETETPILTEVRHIFDHSVREHVILIDDARNFTGEHDYPDMDEFREFVQSERPGWVFKVEHDIIRIHERK